MNTRRPSPAPTPVRMLCLAACAATLAACLLGPALPCGAATKEELAALVDKMPAADPGGGGGKYTGPAPADAQKVFDELLKGGKDSVAGLVAMIRPGTGEDYKVRYLLHALVTHVARPGAEKDRQMVSEALVSTLGGTAPKAAQASVLQELQALATKEAAAPISRLLLDEELYDFAARALLSIGDTGDLFRQALPQAKGRIRVAIIQALGALRDAKAVGDLTKAAADADVDVRIAALDALGNIGDAGGVDAMLAAADAAKEGWPRIKAAEAAMVLAKRLAQADNKRDAERIYRRLWDTRTAPEDRSARAAALVGLAEVRGDMNDLLAAMKTNDPQIRALAIRLAAETPGQDATAKCVAAMEKAAPVERANLLTILGARADATALPAVLGRMKDDDESVRIAAAQAAASIGGPQAVEALIALLSAKAGKERDAAVEALGKARGKETNGLVASAMMKAADPAAKAALLGVLAERGAADQVDAIMELAREKDVFLRVAAIKALGALAGDRQLAMLVDLIKTTRENAELRAAEQALATACSRNLADRCTDLVAAALAGAAPGNAAAMLRVLGAAGTRKAIETLRGRTKDTSADVQDAAVRALAESRSKEAVGPLLEIARTSDNPTHKVLALRAAIRLASAKNVAGDERLNILSEAMKAAARPEEKREVLAGLGGVQTADALKMAAACLDEDAVKEEAAAAVVQIAEGLVKKNPDAVRDAVGKAAAVTKNDRVRTAAQKILAQVKKP